MTDNTPIGMETALLAAARNYRRAVVVAIGLGGVGLVVSAVTGQFVAGVLFCVGLVLGAVNGRLVQRSLASFVEAGDPNKRKLMLGVLRRLLLISAIAFAIAVVYQPIGWVVLLGLAVFQILVMGTVFGGLYREVRRA